VQFEVIRVRRDACAIREWALLFILYRNGDDSIRLE